MSLEHKLSFGLKQNQATLESFFAKNNVFVQE